MAPPQFQWCISFETAPGPVETWHIKSQSANRFLKWRRMVRNAYSLEGHSNLDMKLIEVIQSNDHQPYGKI